ncbi:MAG: hypothetical protein MJE77_13635 [Proteobacteria bacterium]|nr:hypothetical protein [Pseudomonadota bacterium]
MNATPTSPFEVVKATDLTDQQIADYWVDLSEGGSLLELIKPTSPVPMFILGGKGSGKTHLMRYISSDLQRRRAHGKSFLDQIAADGYLGLYLRCGGLNARRFANKGQPPEAWSQVFSYYVELWLSQILLTTVQPLLAEFGGEGSREFELVGNIRELCDTDRMDNATTIDELISLLRELQRESDHAINNCAVTRTLSVEIHITPTRLLFGIPQLLARSFQPFSDVRFVYLFDELETLSVDQQRYVNTLIRDQTVPCTFKVGARLYGIHTYQILGSDEANREGSEFEVLRLDDMFRKDKRAYTRFARNLVVRRLDQAGYTPTPKAADLKGYFETFGTDRLLEVDTRNIVEKYRDSERPYLARLRSRLLDGYQQGFASGITSPAHVDELVDVLRFDDFPFLERTAVFLFYRHWAQGDDLATAAAAIRSACEGYRNGQGSKTNEVHKIMKHFRADIIAQLLRDTQQRQIYLGIDNFIAMSSGLPRNLLTTLKHIYKWAVFRGEEPFRDTPISRDAQQRGVLEASDWFFDDARAPGRQGHAIRNGMERLCRLFQALRYSDKPSECSLSTFSVQLSDVSEEARQVIQGAVDWSMLIQVPRGHSDRNTGRTKEKYQIAPMLAPRWDLPIASRGTYELKPAEVDAIFAPQDPDMFNTVLRTHEAGKKAPRFDRKRAERQTSLPGISGD